MENISSILMAKAFKRILFRSRPRVPYNLQSDRGKEFLSSCFQEVLEANDIIFGVVRNPNVKAAIVERFNRTLKERLWRYFTYTRTKRYIDVLQNIIAAYDHTKHSGTKMVPCEVNESNCTIAVENLQKRYQSNVKKNSQTKTPKYKRGDLVRISSAKAAFMEGYKSRWSKEIFQIRCVSCYRLPCVYLLADLNGEDINGIFYEEELSKIQLV